ncbi:MAG: carboxypeptidase-like regulatory domain-containing protein, partial [Acidobacteriota bacterium]|nr:carboxypeptidase-like regulatory domain-containing protein [Acidobacteriota bacterium]
MRVCNTRKVLFCLIAFASASWAQVDSGRIIGSVTDPSGAVIPNATVTAKNEKTGEERSAKSNEDGAYILSNLAPASYSIEGKAESLGATQFKGIAVSVGQERNLN